MLYEGITQHGDQKCFNCHLGGKVKKEIIMGGEAGITLHGDQKDFGCHQGELKEEGEKIGGGGGLW